MRQSRGNCVLCGRELPKNSITRHIAVCAERVQGPDLSYHIVVQAPPYWLHVATRSKARLADLDAFLRNIWLECCGHLSSFEIEGESYDSDPYESARDMNVLIRKVLRPGQEFGYTYDFGTSTYLKLQVVAEIRGASGPQKVILLARNLPIAYSCVNCGKPATQTCAQCGNCDDAWLCDTCASQHECGEEMMLPVVNSPRVGQCAYTGTGN